MDDGNVVVFDMEVKKIICGLVACKGRNGFPRTVVSTNTRNDCWVIGGDDYLSVWILDTNRNKIRPEKVNLKKIKRDITSVVIDPEDKYAFCGTTTGDIVKVKLNLPPRDGYVCDQVDPIGPGITGPIINGVIQRAAIKGEVKVRNAHLYKGGITALWMLESGSFLVGTGSGIVTEGSLKPVCRPNGVQDHVLQVRNQMSEWMILKNKITYVLHSTPCCISTTGTRRSRNGGERLSNHYTRERSGCSGGVNPK